MKSELIFLTRTFSFYSFFTLLLGLILQLRSCLTLVLVLMSKRIGAFSLTLSPSAGRSAFYFMRPALFQTPFLLAELHFKAFKVVMGV